MSNDEAVASLSEVLDELERVTLRNGRLQGLTEARAACERQTQLASVVAGRPTDFEKGVMSCIMAIQAEMSKLIKKEQPTDK